MLGLRTLYYRSGELLTLIMGITICFYLFWSLNESSVLMNGEHQARAHLREIHRLEWEVASARSAPYFSPLSEIKDGSPLLADLKKLHPHLQPGAELFSDTRYFYYFILEYELQDTKTYLSGHAEEQPRGFRILAWPADFAKTGELAFYTDDRGELWVSSNSRAALDGQNDFPPDMRAVVSAVEGDPVDSENTDWRRDRGS